MLETAPITHAQDMMSRFQSLGDNCEFGFVQRHFGCEMLGLFRFNWIGMEALLRGIGSRFEGVGNPDNFYIDSDQAGELIIQDKIYGFYTHTGRYEGQIERDKLMQLELTRLTFLVRTFFEDLSTAEKIFVRKGDGSGCYENILPLHQGLQAFGPNTLLWVVAADELHPSGTVEQIETGLLKGYLTRFAPYGFAQDFLADEWNTLCANAYAEAGKP
jgi:hypothetical protein